MTGEKRESEGRGSNAGLLSQIFNFEAKMKTADLSAGETVEDTQPANACVRVHTNDGRRGTMSHLDISIDPSKFAQGLRQRVGSGVPVILDGGDSNSDMSRLLLREVHEALTDQGFVVGSLDDKKHNDTGGNRGRTAILSQEGVVVTRLGGAKPEKIKLIFPK